MSYVTLNDLRDRFGERLLIRLTDREAVATGVIDTDMVDKAIADAAAIIDGYLAARYALPVSALPELLVKLARVIALYELYTTDVPEKIATDYKDAIRTLGQISDGKIRLPIAGAATAKETGGTGARVTDRARPMTEQKMKGFI